MIEALVTMKFGGFSRALPSPGVETSITILGAGIYPQELLIPVAAAAATLGLRVLQKRTLIGRAMTAVAFNRQAAALMGINVDMVVAFSFALAAAMGGAAGILVAPVIQASSTMGLILGLKGFAAAILGGLGSGAGAVVGGLLLSVMGAIVSVNDLALQ